MNEEQEHHYGPESHERRKPGALDKLTETVGRIEKKLDEHILRTAPVVEAYGRAQFGYKIGHKVLNWGQRSFNWLLSKWQPILVIFGGYQIMSHGGTWNDVWEKVMKIFK